MVGQTISQVKAGLKRRPDILQAILKLPAIEKAYPWAKKLTPHPLWNSIARDITTNHALSEKPILPLTKADVDSFGARTHVRIDKARRLLGYQPDFDLEQGMKLTEMWARYANLV